MPWSVTTDRIWNECVGVSHSFLALLFRCSLYRNMRKSMSALTLLKWLGTYRLNTYSVVRAWFGPCMGLNSQCNGHRRCRKVEPQISLPTRGFFKRNCNSWRSRFKARRGGWRLLAAFASPTLLVNSAGGRNRTLSLASQRASNRATEAGRKDVQ